jgi:TPR repeat protein|tara:strand:+ start:1048 stop:1653 length:606 start_codon:yes stop_codon:yes gene_type:complete
MSGSALKSTILLILMALLLPLTGWSQPMTSCDWEVAHPSDPHRVGPGVSSSDVDTERAMAACRQALLGNADNPRFQYQLARAIVYHAERHHTSHEEGMRYLAQSAHAGYTQAMFVYGLMLTSEDRTCEAPYWMGRAAEAGLKAARIGYVEAATSGRWSACNVPLDVQSMTAFLDGAEEQVSGYYENLLLGTLRSALIALNQ